MSPHTFAAGDASTSYGVLNERTDTTPTGTRTGHTRAVYILSRQTQTLTLTRARAHTHIERATHEVKR